MLSVYINDFYIYNYNDEDEMTVKKRAKSKTAEIVHI